MTNTMMKNLMHLICSRSSTTARKKNATPQLYRRLLVRWKTSYLQQQKVKNLSQRLKLLLMCLLRTPRRIGSCRMWASIMPSLDSVSRALRQN
ncbi:hypothetical protein EE612_005170 [Oryza sativa]|nr:hypothetical protein EE612_005170 [Oryza sativa]